MTGRDAGGGKINLILLPGMDGTGDLFEEFVSNLPSWVAPQVVSYPLDQKLSYAQLSERVEAVLPSSEPFAILAESFSSPLAVRIAARGPENLKPVILCAGFVATPVGPVARSLEISSLNLRSGSELLE
jgi:hypothetical protein